jgi:glucose/arabinose dehydrogenase
LYRSGAVRNFASFALLALPLLGCSSPDASDAGPTDATTVVGWDGYVPLADFHPAIANPCSLPGSIQYTNAGMKVVPGGPSTAPDLTYLKVPAGFCIHYFGNVGNARQLRFAPGGELFVASPTTGTTGGGPGGRAGIVVLPDDNQDGYAEPPVTFLSGIASTQGLLFTPGQFYYQDGQAIKVMPYGLGQRVPGSATVAVNITVYSSPLHWPKVLDVADDGTIYVGNGGDQGELCDPTRPFHGGILKIDGSPGGAEVAKGLRNPIALRCAPGHNMCFALELAMDYSNDWNGREKLLPIRQGDDWGFPCCATQNLPYTNVIPKPDCSGTAAEIDGFYIGDTPFGIDFERGQWPAPYANSAFVTLHGVAGTWAGERLVAVGWDTNSGMPLPGNDINNMVDTGAMGDFVTGWDNAGKAHGRPSALTFSADGRLFVANDNNGEIFWIASMTQ